MLTYRRISIAIRLRMNRLFGLAREMMVSERLYHCPACEADVAAFYDGPQGPYGCPHCACSPRERLAVHALKTNSLKIPSGASILHMAPNERSLHRLLRTAAADYVPGDYHPEIYANVGCRKIDLTAIGERERFDVIYASHVMEHIPEDRKAMRSMYEALKPGGEVWLMVPLERGPTRETDRPLTPWQRERLFGQWDHVRAYGDDFGDRLEDCGFKLSVVAPSQMPSAEIRKLGLDYDDKIFVGRRS
jgi:SAM-dependent methyltransferase